MWSGRLTKTFHMTKISSYEKNVGMESNSDHQNLGDKMRIFTKDHIFVLKEKDDTKTLSTSKYDLRWSDQGKLSSLKNDGNGLTFTFFNNSGDTEIFLEYHQLQELLLLCGRSMIKEYME